MSNLIVKPVETSQELKDAQEVRRQVFIEEQGINREADIDGLDQSSDHIIVYDNNNPVGTARVRYKNRIQAKLERIAVLKSYRGRGIGKRIIEASLGLAKTKGALEAILDAQQSASGFYEKLGFRQVGEPFEEVGIPHILMTKRLLKTRMTRSLLPSDFDATLRVINDAAQAYKGVIPDDRWKEPYMSAEELKEEIKAGVKFFGWVENDHLLGVAGIQAIRDTTLIRHTYVATKCQRRGIGSRLVEHLMSLAQTPRILVGTWADATWAIRFYQKHGFNLVSPEEKDRLLRTYWNILNRQVETSVVLKFTR